MAKQDTWQEGISGNYYSGVENRPNSWGKVVIGGTAGILMGLAGSLVVLNHIDQTDDFEDSVDDDQRSDVISEPDNEVIIDGEEGVVISELSQADVMVALVSDDMSFKEAFAEARSQVGSGGVFEWHGALFNTYYVEEWDAMTSEEKNDFAERVPTMLGADEVDIEEVFADADNGQDVQIVTINDMDIIEVKDDGYVLAGQDDDVPCIPNFGSEPSTDDIFGLWDDGLAEV